MRRLWIRLFALMAMNSMLLSACPMQAPGSQAVEHGGGGGGGGGGY